MLVEFRSIGLGTDRRSFLLEMDNYAFVASLYSLPKERVSPIPQHEHGFLVNARRFAKSSLFHGTFGLLSILPMSGVSFSLA